MKNSFIISARFSFGFIQISIFYDNFQWLKKIGQNADIIPNFRFRGAKEVRISGFWPFAGTALKDIGSHVTAACRIPAPGDIWLP